jgi:hypothetical protein
MKISQTFYNDAGELMAPRPLDVKLGAVTPGGKPSLDAGFYHRFKFEGRTEAELESKRQRFFAEMQSLPGYMSLVVRPYTVCMDSFVRYGVDVLYAIEAATDEPAPSAERARSSRTQTSTIIVTTR